ncbi:MAG: hypothetical protein QOJ20_1230 [Mycobacterium sp.]|jgi:hypothetical protein|nr:hypothetical protein [Mycobacterium sp.]MDT5280035.1 hypothetical protein [Mycobacterium sp.]
MTVRIELLTAPGCPHAAAARATITECVSALGIDATIIDRVGRYPSPTVLVDGVDVMRPGSGVRSGDACRLDLPTPQRVLDALHRRNPR